MNESKPGARGSQLPRTLRNGLSEPRERHHCHRWRFLTWPARQTGQILGSTSALYGVATRMAGSPRNRGGGLLFSAPSASSLCGSAGLDFNLFGSPLRIPVQNGLGRSGAFWTRVARRAFMHCPPPPPPFFFKLIVQKRFGPLVWVMLTRSHTDQISSLSSPNSCNS